MAMDSRSISHRRFLASCRRPAAMRSTLFKKPSVSGRQTPEVSVATVKRYLEPSHSRRPWIIWFFDTSKQAFGASVVHFANILLADMFHGDPCTWYFISFLLDSSVGLFVIYLGLKLTQVIAHRNAYKLLYFGEYGKPPQCNAWIGQTGLYIIVMMVEKVVMTFLVLPSFWIKVRKFIMSPIKSPQLELALVMFVIPLIVNALLFWVIDNFLKRSIQHQNTIYVTCHEPTVKYSHSSNSVMCYNRIDKDDESDLLSVDDDINELYHGIDPVE